MQFMFLGGDPTSPLKAIDFGISVFCRPGQYVDVRAGTPIYIAPEVLRMNYTLSADIWSLGIVAYQLLTGRLPFGGEDGEEVSENYMAKQVRCGAVGVRACVRTGPCRATVELFPVWIHRVPPAYHCCPVAAAPPPYHPSTRPASPPPRTAGI